MSDKPLSPYAVLSGNIFRCVMAESHSGAAIKAILAHHFDPDEDENPTPGLILHVRKVDEFLGDSRAILAERAMRDAGIALAKPEEVERPAPTPETDAVRDAYMTIPEGDHKFAANPTDFMKLAQRLERERDELRIFIAETFDFPGEFHDSDIVPVTTTGWHVKEARRLANPQPNLKSDTK